MKALFLTLFLTLSYSVTGQVDSFQQSIIECLHLNGTPSNSSDIYEQTIEILKIRFKTAEVPEDFWMELKKDKTDKINEIIPILAFAYRKHFNQDDIIEMIVFYKSETAQTMLENPIILSETQNKEIDTFFESDIGLKIKATKKDLSKDMSTIYRDWKNEIFSEKMSALVKNGYTPKS